MRATNFRALCVSAALGAALGLTGCVSVHHDRGYDQGRYDGDYYDDYDYGHEYDYGHPPFRSDEINSLDPHGWSPYSLS